MLTFIRMFPYRLAARLAALDASIRRLTMPAWRLAAALVTSVLRVTAGVVVGAGAALAFLCSVSPAWAGFTSSSATQVISLIKHSTQTCIDVNGGSDELCVTDGAVTITGTLASSGDVTIGGGTGKVTANSFQGSIIDGTYCLRTSEGNTVACVYDNTDEFRVGDGSGTPLDYIYCTSATINYASIPANSTITMLVEAGSHSNFSPCMTSAQEFHTNHVTGNCYVDNAGDIYLRLANDTTVAVDPASQVYHVCIIDYE